MGENGGNYLYIQMESSISKIKFKIPEIKMHYI